MKKRASKKTSPAAPSVPLTFSLPAAAQVCVAGNFNHWSANATPCQRDSSGTWRVDLPLSPGRYEFRLVVDDVWTDPPAAAETVDNGFGSRNAVLHVPSR